MTRYTKLEGRKPTAAKADSKSLFDEAVEKTTTATEPPATEESHDTTPDATDQQPPTKKAKLDNGGAKDSSTSAAAPTTKTAKLKRIKLLKLKCKKAKTPEKRMELRREISKLEKEVTSKDYGINSGGNGNAGSDSGWPKKAGSISAAAAGHTNPWKAMEAERRSKTEAKSEARRVQRISERTSTLTCFACRGTGHSAKDCPNTFNAHASSLPADSANASTATGKEAVGHCFRCNSHAHILARCPAKRKRDAEGIEILPYATCFVCSEQGHIAAACPANEKGVFAMGDGASCGYCKSVRHRARDCPTRLEDAAGGDEADESLKGEVLLDGDAIVRREKKKKSVGKDAPAVDTIRKKVVSF